MEISARQAASAAAICMIATVITQVGYMALPAIGIEVNSKIIWTIEAVAFLGIGVFALVAMARQAGPALAWSAIAIGGILNVVQVGMGLAMFGPVKDAGEAMLPAFQAILAGAFFFYFAGKFLFGLAAVVLGAALFITPRAPAKIFGVLTILVGMAAVGLNLAGMAVGMDVVFPAGASGTAAALFAAIACVMAVSSTGKIASHR
jgi:hypothetical protein